MVAKPDWDDAPLWAKYLAQSYNEQWSWYESMPTPNSQGWNTTGKVQKIPIKTFSWFESLEKNPRLK